MQSERGSLPRHNLDTCSNGLLLKTYFCYFELGWGAQTVDRGRHAGERELGWWPDSQRVCSTKPVGLLRCQRRK